MDDADAGRHDVEGLEGLHAPLEELVAFAVAGELDVQIERERFGGAGEIDLHGMVDHQVHRHERLDDFRVFAQLATAVRMAARSTNSGTPVKSCKTMRATTKGISAVRTRTVANQPVGGRMLGHPFAVAIAEHGFQDQPDGDRQVRHRANPSLLEAGEASKGPWPPFPSSNDCSVSKRLCALLII